MNDPCVLIRTNNNSVGKSSNSLVVTFNPRKILKGSTLRNTAGFFLLLLRSFKGEGPCDVMVIAHCTGLYLGRAALGRDLGSVSLHS